MRFDKNWWGGIEVGYLGARSSASLARGPDSTAAAAWLDLSSEKDSPRASSILILIFLLIILHICFHILLSILSSSSLWDRIPICPWWNPGKPWQTSDTLISRADSITATTINIIFWKYHPKNWHFPQTFKPGQGLVSQSKTLLKNYHWAFIFWGLLHQQHLTWWNPGSGSDIPIRVRFRGTADGGRTQLTISALPSSPLHWSTLLGTDQLWPYYLLCCSSLRSSLLCSTFQQSLFSRLPLYAEHSLLPLSPTICSRLCSHNPPFSSLPLSIWSRLLLHFF